MMSQSSALPDAPAFPPGPDLGAYVWLVFKNLLGWLLILASLVVGPLVPGPGGIPLFLIGFALITFPGKRRLTARVLRGKKLDPRHRRYWRFSAAVSLLLPLGTLAILALRRSPMLHDWVPNSWSRFGWLALAAAILWLASRLGIQLANVLLRWMPLVRKKVRPWLRHHGIRLLPPRRLTAQRLPREDILDFHERHHQRVRWMWAVVRPWLRRAAGAAVVALIFFWILRPILKHWPQVSARIMQTSPWRFALAAGMFSLFLLVFRSTSWRWILKGLHHPIPFRPATRIWCASELARYLPGVIWQVVGRVYLSKPYGLSTAVSSVSQVLELTIFLLANILVAVSCLLFYGGKISPEARPWLHTAIVMVPVLLLVLHPRIFYSAMNGILRRLKKSPITQRLTGRRLVGLVVWAFVGLLWQSLAVWVLTRPVLDLPIQKWWILAGAYCLAWSVGFTAGSVTPGGIGVREFVFMTTLRFALPQVASSTSAANSESLEGFLGFLAILLRLWATAGELLLAAAAHLLDWRGALGREDAPGRIESSLPPQEITHE